MWPRNTRTHNHKEALGKHKLAVCVYAGLYEIHKHSSLSMQLFPFGIPWLVTLWLSLLGNHLDQRLSPKDSNSPRVSTHSQSFTDKLLSKKSSLHSIATWWGSHTCTLIPHNRKQLSQLRFPRQMETVSHSFLLNFSFVPFILEQEEPFHHYFCPPWTLCYFQWKYKEFIFPFLRHCPDFMN